MGNQVKFISRYLLISLTACIRLTKWLTHSTYCNSSVSYWITGYHDWPENAHEVKVRHGFSRNADRTIIHQARFVIYSPSVSQSVYSYATACFFATSPFCGSKGYWLSDPLKLWSDFSRGELRYIDVPRQNGTFDISAVVCLSLADCKHLEGVLTWS
ncbi:hypothetical protein BDR06DRAFT_959681 [Suillus hirtellus]|nr:hypothetical protein BDR06DRAFT_959681 [Suillus hirtellus]